MSAVPAYFDFNATTPMSAPARLIWQETAEKHWQNPSSLYREAAAAKEMLEYQREQLADAFAIDEPERIVFSSGATESNNAVIRYFSEILSKPLAVSAIEHPCVEAPVKAAFSDDRVRTIPVDPETGVVDLEILGRWLGAGEVGAVSVMAANNETGVLQPWEEIAEACQEAGVLFHTDAAQWIGKCPLNDLGECGFVTGSAHKFGGGKGAGFLLLPPGDLEEPFHQQIGGPQENGYRAGTENLPAVAAMVVALLEQEDRGYEEIEKVQSQLRDAFEAAITAKAGCRVVAKKGPRLWNTSMFLVPHSKNLKWLTRLGLQGMQVSTGSACSAGRGNPSSVMLAMGLGYEEMGRVLRVSGGWDTSEEDWERLAACLVAIEGELRG
jgi:cysteine desulfurase